ncbi:fibropellin-1 [Caerostris extrusa]|uniref:Fibropellin-1 n=1 Tax=Caerostris extrusa TaxID=172846 RepID=A0AAV4YAG2_CAEEX|nr:fibropellin-1 [Caerostris extrusa]
MFHYGDVVSFHCDFAYVMIGNPTILCTSNGVWNGSVPTCEYAYCERIPDDPSQGLFLETGTEEKYIPFFENVTVSCHETGRPLRTTATSGFRQCVFDPHDGMPMHWLSGARPSCPRIDCGPPPETPWFNLRVSCRYQVQSQLLLRLRRDVYTGRKILNERQYHSMSRGWNMGLWRLEM